MNFMRSRDEIIKAAAGGVAAAEQFLRVFAERAHLLDDVVDGDKLVTDEMLAKSEADWLMQWTGNPWVREHSVRLVPVVLLALNAWVDSNRMPAGPVRDVLKGQWHEVYHLVGLITGGWTALRVLTSGAGGREFDFEVPIAHTNKDLLRVLEGSGSAPPKEWAGNGNGNGK